MLGKIEGDRRRGQQKVRWLDGITTLMDMNLNELQETVKDKGAWRAAVHAFAKTRLQLSNGTTAHAELLGLTAWTPGVPHSRSNSASLPAPGQPPFHFNQVKICFLFLLTKLFSTKAFPNQLANKRMPVP